MAAPSISAFCPCYNDGGTIASMVIMMDRVLRGLTDDYEIIVIDDHSRDHSRTVLEELRATYPRLRVVLHEANRGYGGALRSGFASATKELIFYTDGDFQYDVAELPLLAAEMREGVHVVNGYKISRSDELYRGVIGRLYHWTMRLMFSLPIRDVDCDFRLIRRSAMQRITLEHNSGVICVELVKKLHDAGCVFVEVPVHHYARAYGKSQFFKIRRIARVGIEMLGLWWKLVVKQEGKRAA